MTFRSSLNGTWELFRIPCAERISSPEELSSFTPFPGEVPGNIELALNDAGFEDAPFFGLNARQYAKYEYDDFWYRCTFSSDFTGPSEIVLEGVDCFAEIFVNGRKIGECFNAFIPWCFPVELKKENTIAVRILSAEIAARRFPDVPGILAHSAEVQSAMYLRRGAHETGWDIFPRLALGGLWKGVWVRQKGSPFEFRDVWVQTISLAEDRSRASLRLYYHFAAGEESLLNCHLKFKGRCGGSVWEVERPAWFTSGCINFDVEEPAVWEMRAYGEPHLYDITASLTGADGTLLAEFRTSCGIRTVELVTSYPEKEGEGEFLIKVNGRKVRICGSNHVPLDALHSRDAGRMEKSLEVFEKLNCNMIRCWGGGVYESDEFYSRCDRKGILVWQDFMFACGFYPQNEAFFAMVRPEIEFAAKLLRRHPSVVLYCGDNECDQCAFYEKFPLKMNRLSREVIPQILQQQDPSRPYLPSSPYFPAGFQEKYDYFQAVDLLPERHLWGERDFFKNPFYADSQAAFISETGWLSAPVYETVAKFLSPEHLRLDCSSPEWDLHSTNPYGAESVFRYRKYAVMKTLENYLTEMPRTLRSYILFSQIYQAEALKFQVERARCREKCNGILWWNAVDGWPQFSDAVVDYFHTPKLAFFYLRNSQSPFTICCTDPFEENAPVMALNDSCRECQISYKVSCENGKTVLAGSLEMAPFTHCKLGELPFDKDENVLYFLEWECEGKKMGSHYISGNWRIDPAWYRKILPVIAQKTYAEDFSEFVTELLKDGEDDERV